MTDDMQPILDNLNAAFAGLPVVRSPRPAAADPGDATDDAIADFENALESSVAREAAKIQRNHPDARFEVSDCEVTCIPDGDLIRVLVSVQSEVTLRRDQIQDLDNGIAALAATHGLLWSRVS